MGKIVTAMWAWALLILALGAMGGGPGARATEGDWEPTALRGRVVRLFTPSRGAFLVRTDDGLFRSDDAGSTWVAVALPPAPGAIVVDPADHDVLYAGGADGLYKTVDGAASWALVLPTADFPTTERVLQVTVSPAEPDLVYVALTGRGSPSADFRFLRSRDGGAGWEGLEEAHNSLCGWSVPILEPHPVDAGRLFRTAGCYAGRDLGDDLMHSADQGGTWSVSIRPELAFPARLAGGSGAAPARFYLATNRDARAGGSSVFRSDDDAATWAEVLAFRGGGITVTSNGPDVRIGGLAYDPARPHRVYAGLNAYLSRAANRPLSGSEVLASPDGGTTWARLGRADLGEIRDLALGVDGLNLYAATDQGLWRLRLDGIPSGQPPPQVPAR